MRAQVNEEQSLTPAGPLLCHSGREQLGLPLRIRTHLKPSKCQVSP